LYTVKRFQLHLLSSVLTMLLRKEKIQTYRYQHRFTYASDYSRKKGGRTPNQHNTTVHIYI